jgi:transcriptional regulator with XRE-family HTH domain
MNTFGDTLIFYRHRAKLTQKDLATKIEMTRDHISALECGEALPRYTTMEKLAAALECHPAEFFPGWRSS